MPGIRPARQPFVQPRSAVANWGLEDKDHISLLDVVRNAKPTTRIGVSGQAGAFTEEVIRAMAAAKCLAELSPARRSKSGQLLPPVSELRSASFAVAKAVARQAINDGVACPLDERTEESRIRANVWEPVYLPYRFDPSA